MHSLIFREKAILCKYSESRVKNKILFYSSEGMNTCNGIDGGFTPTDGWLLVRERRQRQRARSAQGAAQFAAGHAAARQLRPGI